MTKVPKGAIITFTGKIFFPLDPNPDDIDPRDIAHALSNQCRYTGHTRFHYSVATHSCLLYDAGLKAGCDIEVCKTLLMHDSGEAFMIDLPAPLKHHPNGFGEKFCEAEIGVDKAVAERFGLVYPFDPTVKDFDLGIREDEIDQLFNVWLDREPRPRLGVKIPKWTPAKGEKEMLWRMKRHGWI